MRLTADDVAAVDVAQAFTLFHAFYAGLEPVLVSRLGMLSLAGLYRPRCHLLADDLATLGYSLPQPWPSIVPDDEAGLLGLVYAIEGSALGGQVVARHLRSRLGAEFSDSLTFFSALTNGVGAHWQRVLAALRQALGREPALDAMSAAANGVFASLIRLAETCSSEPCLTLR